MRRLVFILVCLCVNPLISATPEPAAPLDRLEIKDGAVLTGRIESVSGDVVQLDTDYAGLLLVNVDQIVRVVLGLPRELSFPEDLMVFSGAESQREEAAQPEKKPKPAVAKKEAPAPPEPPSWKIDAGFNFTGKQGNADKFDYSVNIDAVLDRDHDRSNLYGRYVYGTNRGVNSSNEIILGGRYTTYVFNGTGLFIREELEYDKFEGINLRSTTASGVTYKFRDEEKLRIEGRSGLSYRYEDFRDDGDDNIPGMDLGVEIAWQFVEWARFKGSYTYIPSVRDLEEYIFEQDSGISLPLSKESLWKLRFGVYSQFNNQPDFGKEKLDMRYYARLITTWN